MSASRFDMPLGWPMKACIRPRRPSREVFRTPQRRLLRHQRQERLLRIGELGDPFGHQRRFELLHVHQPVDLLDHRGRRKLVDLPGEGAAAAGDGLVGGGRIGLDVAAGEGLDVLPGRIAGLLRARAGKDDLLLSAAWAARPSTAGSRPKSAWR